MSDSEEFGGGLTRKPETACHGCGSSWSTGESINWHRESCPFCGSEEIA